MLFASANQKKKMNYNSVSKTIFMQYNNLNTEDKHVKFLVNEYNYQVQTEIC